MYPQWQRPSIFISSSSAAASSGTNAGDDPHLAISGVIGAGWFPTSLLQQAHVLGFGPFLAGAPTHHVNIKQLGKMRHVMLRHDVLDHEEPCGSGRGLPDVGQDRDALRVVPI